MRDAIRTLYAYNRWANTRLLDSAERLTLQQFIATNGGAESIRDVLVHTASAQGTWLDRWQEASPRGPWHAADFPYVATLRARWDEVEAASQRYLAGLTETDLARDVPYVNFRGQSRSYPLWQQMLHQANHATHHRSEAALLLTRLGHSPGDLDLIVYYDEPTGLR